MEGECEQIQRQQQIGQSLVPVSKVMLHVIAQVFQHVKGFIFDFPSGSAALCELHDIVTIDIYRSDKTVAIGPFIVALANDLDGQPVDLQGVFAILDGHLQCPLITPGFGFAVGFSHRDSFGLQRDAVEIFIQGLVRGRFRDEQEITAELNDFPTQRLSRIQVIAQVKRSQVLIARVILIQPSFGGIVFTVLFAGTILGDDEFGSKRNHAMMFGCHDGGAQYVVMIRGDALAGAGAALAAVNVPGVVELGGVECDQEPLVEA